MKRKAQALKSDWKQEKSSRIAHEKSAAKQEKGEERFRGGALSEMTKEIEMRTQYGEYRQLVRKWRQIRNRNIKHRIPGSSLVNMSEYLKAAKVTGTTRLAFTKDFNAQYTDGISVITQVKSCKKGSHQQTLGLPLTTWLCDVSYFGFVDLMFRSRRQQSKSLGKIAMVDANFLQDLCRLSPDIVLDAATQLYSH